jgi:hypothetical protein
VCAAAKDKGEAMATNGGGVGKVCDGRVFNDWVFWQSVDQIDGMLEIDAMLGATSEVKECLARAQAALDAHQPTCPVCSGLSAAKSLEILKGKTRAQRLAFSSPPLTKAQRTHWELKTWSLQAMRESLIETAPAYVSPEAMPPSSGLRRLRRDHNGDADPDTETL